MHSPQLFVGRTHQIGIEVEGVNYEVSLNSDADLRERAKALPLGQGAAGSADGQVRVHACDWHAPELDLDMYVCDAHGAGP